MFQLAKTDLRKFWAFQLNKPNNILLLTLALTLQFQPIDEELLIHRGRDEKQCNQPPHLPLLAHHSLVLGHFNKSDPMDKMIQQANPPQTVTRWMDAYTFPRVCNRTGPFGGLSRHFSSFFNNSGITIITTLYLISLILRCVIFQRANSVVIFDEDRHYGFIPPCHLVLNSMLSEHQYGIHSAEGRVRALPVFPVIHRRYPQSDFCQSFKSAVPSIVNGHIVHNLSALKVKGAIFSSECVLHL
ncbi:hypothetical protein EGR_03901 [Echinococcus granulosus]|uniref:Uncharacterized protein n=1 Tax=Echinococcus granulosus TaxID=6210 RepID=W6UJA2_ECHGR|nr:hypothetical protein EGR_03901 [Echinococcus granulosus]EUB61226.1 hypothetical protein EGR_03901 [Echinococcus granulosus]